MKVVVADIRKDALRAATEELRADEVEASSFLVDVSDAQSVDRLAEHTMDKFGRVDLVCNNAGVVPPAAPTWEQEPRTWQRMIEIKLLGVVHGVASFAPILIDQGRGHFLNTASSGGLAPLPGRAPYAATMHAVVGLTETLNLELKQESADLGATVLSPGLVDTQLGANSAALGVIDLPKGSHASMRAVAAGGILTPGEVAEAAIAAIEAGRVHVAPGAGVAERAYARVEALLQDLASSAESKPG